MVLDPFVITASVAKLTTSLAEAAVGCGKLMRKYCGAPLLLSSIQVECKTLNMALNHVYAKVHRILKDWGSRYRWTRCCERVLMLLSTAAH